MSTHPSNLQHSLEFTVQFVHPDRTVSLPGMTDAIVAALLEITPERYAQLRAQFATRVRSAAEELLSDAAFSQQIDALPFRQGATLVGLGDSITDDRQSWFEILCTVLELRRGSGSFAFVNAGISGDTTARLIERFLGVVQAQPDWVLCLAGTNDARLHGLQPTKTLVSAEETERNLAMLRAYAARQTSARWVWMTPPPVLEAKIAAYWGQPAFQMMWRNADLRAVAALMQQLPPQYPGDLLVDLQSAFGPAPAAELLLFDGLHPSLEGQKLIVRALVERLASTPA